MSVDTWLARATVEVPVLPRAGRSRRVDLALAIGVLAALLGALLPLLSVLELGAWLGGSIAITALVLATGVVSRWFRVPGLAVALCEIVVLLAALTATFGRDTAILWVVPTPDTFASVPALISSASEEILLGAAPLTAGTGLTFLIVASMGLLALAIDHVVLTARMPLLAAVGLVSVSLIPSIAVPGDIDLASFLLLAVSILFLLRTDTRARQSEAAAVGARPVVARGATDAPIGGASATALGIGAIAVVIAVVASPLLPAPAVRAGNGGIGGGATIDPSLELGDDLRQPRETDVLSVRSSAANPPYLRAVTLTHFDGSVWDPDEGRTLPADGTFATEPVDPDITVTNYRTTVEVMDLSSPWLPVPYPATGVTGLEGEWSMLPENLTVLSRSTTTSSQVYEVTTAVPRPTLEQIRARPAAGGGDEALDLPSGMPPIIAETANEVTAGANSDYDALLAMQSWFRGPDFDYSLDAPVADGFDGTGADAVAAFLEQHSGYCVHFASAFALMARSLGMPTRIVVGYLPGTSTGQQTQGETVYTVASGQLHAWPEVHFEGIGWVSFEPTKSLGVPTGFSPGSSTTPESDASAAPQSPADENAAPTSSPTPTTGAPQLSDSEAGAAGGGSGAPSPAIGVGLLALVALGTPAVLRAFRRRRAREAARSGDAAAAWSELQDLALDLGVTVPAAESPRAFGARLVADHGAPAEAIEVLVTAIERASYASDHERRRHGFGEGDALGDALDAALSDVRGRAGAARRALAVLAPRSLVIRPGGMFATRATRAWHGAARDAR